MIQDKEVTAQQSRHFIFSLHFLLPVFILAAGTVLFRATELDLTIQNHYYRGFGEWEFNNLPIPLAIYHYGNIPALILSLGALSVFILSFSKAMVLPYRKIAAYLVLAMVIGPGLIANSILKDNWGRPRPRDLVQFGGEYQYEAPLSIDPASSGKSFPCGHATMGFYFFALGFALLHKSKFWACLTVLFALLWGLLIGWIRIGMGGHFASDVLWAGGVVYLTSFILYRLLKLHRQPYLIQDSGKVHRPLKLYQKILLSLLGLIIVVGVLLATPYSAKKTFPISSQISTCDSLKLDLSLQIAELRIDRARQTQFSYRNNGFGFPGSKLKSTNEYLTEAFNFTQWKKGFFTELNCQADLLINPEQVRTLFVSVNEGKVDLQDGLADTLWIDPATRIQGSPSRTIVLPGPKPVTGFWVKAPEISFQ
jgi:membrane-associated PAP2 superfamily phosphatase